MRRELRAARGHSMPSATADRSCPRDAGISARASNCDAGIEACLCAARRSYSRARRWTDARWQRRRRRSPPTREGAAHIRRSLSVALVDRPSARFRRAARRRRLNPRRVRSFGGRTVNSRQSVLPSARARSAAKSPSSRCPWRRVSASGSPSLFFLRSGSRAPFTHAAYTAMAAADALAAAGPNSAIATSRGCSDKSRCSALRRAVGARTTGARHSHDTGHQRAMASYVARTLAQIGRFFPRRFSAARERLIRNARRRLSRVSAEDEQMTRVAAWTASRRAGLFDIASMKRNGARKSRIIIRMSHTSISCGTSWSTRAQERPARHRHVSIFGPQRVSI